MTREWPIEWAEVRASPKQREFQECFFQRSAAGRRASIFFAYGGNRSGKSFVAGVLCFGKYLRDQAVDRDVFWCVGQTFDRSVSGQQRELSRALPRSMLQSQRWDQKIGFGTNRRLVLPTRDGGTCTVEFRSADQELKTFEQESLRGVWVDEAIPEALYDRLLPRLVDRDGWLLYSDIPEQWWHLMRLVHAPPEAAVHCRQFTIYDNAHNLPAGAIEELVARLTQDQRRMRIHGEYLPMEGIVFKEWDPGRHLIRPFPVPAYWPRWRFIDVGGSAPTACGWVAMDEQEVSYVYREYYERFAQVGKAAAHILEASRREQTRATWMDPAAWATDSGRPALAVLYQEAGLPCVPWPRVNVMGEHAMVQKVRYALENDKLFVFNTCLNMAREMATWKHRCDADGRPLATDAYENDNNHLLDGLKGHFATLPTFDLAGAIAVASE